MFKSIIEDMTNDEHKGNEYTFFIPRRLISLNEYIRLNRENRYGGAKEKKNIENEIIYSIKNSHLEDIRQPCFIKFTWYEPNNRRDKDNVCFAKKFILDALQKSGKLENDNNKFIKGFSDNFVYNKVEGVKVEIKSVDNITGM